MYVTALWELRQCIDSERKNQKKPLLTTNTSQITTTLWHDKWFKRTQLCADPEGEQGNQKPLKNCENKEFLGSTGPDPLKIKKLSSRYSMLGHHQHASETAKIVFR